MSCGFVCYVSGRTDPTQFFYNMAVSTPAVPSLAQLKAIIEERVQMDNCLPDGGEYLVSDIEILDFRVGMWVTLDSRRQLYSGCQLNVVRSLTTSTAAGAADRAYKPPRERVLRFAYEAQSLFEALDIDDEGVLRLPGFLRVYRADVDFAVDAFSVLDQKVEGFISYRDFLSLTKVEKLRSFFIEMQQRLLTGGQAVSREKTNTKGDRSKQKDNGRRHRRRRSSSSEEESDSQEEETSSTESQSESDTEDRHRRRKHSKRGKAKLVKKSSKVDARGTHRDQSGIANFNIDDIKVTSAKGYSLTDSRHAASGRSIFEDEAPTGAAVRRFDSGGSGGGGLGGSQYRNQLSVGSTNSNTATHRSNSDPALPHHHAASHQTLEGSDEFDLSSQLSVVPGNTQAKSASGMLLDAAQSRKALQVVDRLKALAQQKQEKHERALHTFSGSPSKGQQEGLSATGSPSLGPSSQTALPTMATLGYTNTKPQVASQR